MKKIEFIINACNNDEKKLVNAVNEYFNLPNQKTMLNLIILILENKLYETGNNSINLTIDNFTARGGFSNNTIIISKKHLKSAKNKQNFFMIINTIFHEFGHFLMELNNKDIVNYSGEFERYFPQYIGTNVNPIYKEVFNDLEMEIFAHIIFYTTNKNEYFARKYGHKNTCEFIEKYAQNKNIIVNTFDDEENKFQLKNYESLPELKYYKPIIIESINKYQQELIKEGLELITDKQRTNLINSFVLVSSNYNKNLFINAINICQNQEIKNDLLENAIVRMIRYKSELQKEV